MSEAFRTDLLAAAGARILASASGRTTRSRSPCPQLEDRYERQGTRAQPHVVCPSEGALDRALELFCGPPE